MRMSDDVPTPEACPARAARPPAPRGRAVWLCETDSPWASSRSVHPTERQALEYAIWFMLEYAASEAPTPAQVALLEAVQAAVTAGRLRPAWRQLQRFLTADGQVLRVRVVREAVLQHDPGWLAAQCQALLLRQTGLRPAQRRNTC